MSIENMGTTVRRTFSGWPATATNVPLLVYSRCEADSVTESIEYGDPSTSNRASASSFVSLPFQRLERPILNLPAASRELSMAVLKASPPTFGESVLGAALI